MKELPYYPNTIKIELTQGCNRKCTFCGLQGIADTHFIRDDTLTKIIALIQTAPRPYRIELGMHGEPLLHPDLLMVLNHLRFGLPQCFIQLITNGDKIRDGSYSIAQILPFVNDLAIDCYDMTFDQIYQEVNKLSELFPKVLAEVMQNGVGFYAEKKKGCKRILLIPPLDLQNNLNVKSRKISTHCGAGVDPKTVTLKNKRCHMPFRQLAFRWDGKVCLCCDDFRGELPIVDAMDETITHFNDVWWHPLFNACRRIVFHKGRILSPCNKCNSQGNRLGLLPDPLGKMTLKEPTEEDFALWREALSKGPLAKVKLREWEQHI